MGWKQEKQAKNCLSLQRNLNRVTNSDQTIFNVGVPFWADFCTDKWSSRQTLHVDPIFYIFSIRKLHENYNMYSHDTMLLAAFYQIEDEVQQWHIREINGACEGGVSSL